jgi:hypothetical protein
MANEFLYDVFRSHNSADKPRAARLESDQVSLPCSTGASEWRRKHSTVLFRDPASAGRRFIPLLLADRKLLDTLRSKKHENRSLTLDLLPLQVSTT